jgi:hypothetical protein
VTQSRIASEVASFRVAVPECTALTCYWREKGRKKLMGKFYFRKMNGEVFTYLTTNTPKRKATTVLLIERHFF